jgi:hypothetical protein
MTSMLHYLRPIRRENKNQNSEFLNKTIINFTKTLHNINNDNLQCEEIKNNLREFSSQISKSNVSGDVKNSLNMLLREIDNFKCK